MNEADGARLVYPLDHPHALSEADRVELLGGKAANLGVMARDLGLPVPPGFVITTMACRGYLDTGWPAGLDDELRLSMTTLENALGRRFGDRADPLLVSVRSGAAVSMPGMMDTILDLGLDDESARGLGTATRDPSFAADCLARFRTMFREIVGTDAPDDPWQQLRLAIEAVFRSWNGGRARVYRAKERIPDTLGTGVTVQAMVFGNRGPDSATGVVFTRSPATGVAGLYGDVLFHAQGEDVVAGTHATEPIAALDARLPDAAAALRNAAGRLEHHYRDLCDIEFTIEDGKLWLLQVRVGKRSPRAALRMAVDMAQDEEFPLSRAEAIARVAPLLGDPPRVSTGMPPSAVPMTSGLGASPGIASGEVALTPEAAVAAADAGRQVILVRAETSPDDVHGMARAAGILTAHGGLASHAAVVARGWGIPAVVGAHALEVGDREIRLSGARVPAGQTITIDGETGAVYLGATTGTSEICPEAVTLLGWAKELGIAVSSESAKETQAGGDAAVGQAGGDAAVGQAGGDAAVGQAGGDAAVGQAGGDAAVGQAGGDAAVGQAGGDAAVGQAGGDAAVGQAGGDAAVGQAGGDAAVGQAGGDAAVGQAGGDAAVGQAGGDAAVGQAVEPDELVAAISVKGMATTDALCTTLGTTPDVVAPVLDALTASGEITTTAGAFRLTETGKARRANALDGERARMGSEPAIAALDAFIDIDSRVKETVTAWQLRPIDGQQVPNDHTDAGYDQSVLERLVVVHEDALAWLEGVGSGWPRAFTYRRRLTSAVAAALAGDGRFVASPRVDSYHGAWFELHEDLIALAGRTREDEVAAGRA